MRESAAWRYLSAHLPKHIHVERLEVKMPPGLADCFWHDQARGISGWLELKFAEPGDREYQAGRIPKLRTTQPIWLNRWARRGVPAGILMRVGSENPTWKLWRATGEHEWANMVNSCDAQKLWTAKWVGGLDVDDLFRTLCDHWNPSTPIRHIADLAD